MDGDGGQRQRISIRWSDRDQLAAVSVSSVFDGALALTISELPMSGRRRKSQVVEPGNVTPTRIQERAASTVSEENNEEVFGK